MRRIIIVMMVIFQATNLAEASEITGKISTDPKAIRTESIQAEPAKPLIVSPESVAEKKPGRAYLSADSQIKNSLPSIPKEPSGQSQVKVLGISRMADDILVKDQKNRIYWIKGKFKRHLLNLSELKKFAGRPVIKMEDSELSGYEQRLHWDGELVRQSGQSKVFVLQDGHGRHIISYEDLKAGYIGQEIFNISASEMTQYI